MSLESLLAEIAGCRICAGHLPFPPNPVLRVGAPTARLLIIGQAPGTKVHASGVPWNDPSGETLRAWMGVDRESFYDTTRIAIMPMGFCYPGRGKSGDLPPRPECAPTWHRRVLDHMPAVKLTLLVGSFAQAYYLCGRRRPTLAETVRNWRDYLDEGFLPLVHPSPRNRRWLRDHPWFEAEVVPHLRDRVAHLTVNT